MNWDKARNFTIFFLILLNIFLLVANIWIKSGRRLTSDQKQDITNLLRQRGIGLNCDIPSQRISVSQLTLKKLDFDYLRLQKIFFENTENLKRIDASEKVTISNGSESLTIEGSHIEYKNDTVTAADKDRAEKIAKSLVKDIRGYFGEFYMYTSEENDSAYIFRFSEKVSGLKVYNNIISVTVYKAGGLRLGLSYLQIGEHYGERLLIIPCDEALFSASDSIIEYEGTENKLTITNIELCYYLHRMTGDEGVAIPCYRISVNYDRIYYINAYTGELVN